MCVRCCQVSSRLDGDQPMRSSSLGTRRQISITSGREFRYDPRMPIRQLSETMINQIAAGEVIERPASVVKELVENALDAGATRVEIVTAGGGLNLIRVTDDGAGIAAGRARRWRSPATAPPSSPSDIHDIRSLGFRGEALPSIGSVSRLSIRSRTATPATRAEIRIEGGRVSAVRAGGRQSRHHGRGARPVLRDAGPAQIHEGRARRKLGHHRRRQAHRDRLPGGALHAGRQRPHRRWTSADRRRRRRPAQAHRARDGRRLSPTMPSRSTPGAKACSSPATSRCPAPSRANALQQYAYVNGRPVRDRLIAGAIRGAFADVLPRDRHAVTVLFLTLDPAHRRRQRASGQGRCPLPRSRAWCAG